jgi:hypothetical protein
MQRADIAFRWDIFHHSIPLTVLEQRGDIGCGYVRFLFPHFARNGKYAAT